MLGGWQIKIECLIFFSAPLLFFYSAAAFSSKEKVTQKENFKMTSSYTLTKANISIGARK